MAEFVNTDESTTGTKMRAEEMVELMFADGLLDREFYSDYQSAFRLLDSNADGSLDIEELNHFFSLDLIGNDLDSDEMSPHTILTTEEKKSLVEEFLTEADFDHDGRIQFHEFLVFVGRHIPVRCHRYIPNAIRKKETSKRVQRVERMLSEGVSLTSAYLPEYQAAFRLLDKNCNGALDRAELIHFFSLDAMRFEVSDDEVSLNPPVALSAEDKSLLVDAFLEEADFDSDGTIQFYEFLYFIGLHIPLKCHRSLPNVIKERELKERSPQVVVKELIESGKLFERMMPDYKKVFSLLDLGDGLLEEPELALYVKYSTSEVLSEEVMRSKARQMLHECDFSYDGKVNFDEFLVFIGTHCSEEEQESIVSNMGKNIEMHELCMLM